MENKDIKSAEEIIAAKVHDSWVEEKRKQGFHHPDTCQILNCSKCHSDIIPYDELPEYKKEYCRVTVRTVLKAQEEYHNQFTPADALQKAIHWCDDKIIKYSHYTSLYPTGRKMAFEEIRDYLLSLQQPVAPLQDKNERNIMLHQMAVNKMRKGLNALRLEVDNSIVNDLIRLFDDTLIFQSSAPLDKEQKKV